MLEVAMLDKQKIYNFIMASVFLSVISTVIIIAGCDTMPTSRLIEEGGFEGIQIGESKRIVLSSLRERGVKRIQVRDSGQRVATHPGQLSDLIDSKKLVVTDYAATAVRLDFADNIVEQSVVSTNIPASIRPAFDYGATREEAFSAVADLMNQNELLEAFDAVPGIDSSYIELDELSEHERNFLMKYDIWFYTLLDQKPFPAAVLLSFEGEELKSIEYREDWGY